MSTDKNDYEIVEPIPLSELEAEMQKPEPDYEIVEPIPLSRLEADLRMPERWKVPDVPTPTKKDWERLRESFTGEDRLAFIEDPSIREELRATLSNFLNPEEEEKRFALAAYFSNMQLKNLKFCYNNLDELIAKYDVNRSSQTVEQAYYDIAAIFQKPEKNLPQRLEAALYSGEGAVAKLAYDTAGFLARLWTEANTTYAKAELLGRGQDEAAAMIRDPQEAGALVEETVRGVYKKYYAETAEHYTQEMQLPENWFTSSDSVGDWVANAVVATVNYIPQLAAQSGITVATGGVSALAFIYGVDGYYDIRDNYPEMSEEEAVAYGVGVALINGMLEKVTLGIIDGKVSKKVAEEGIKKGLLAAASHFGWNMTKEGAAEGMEEFSQNILDIVMGLRGDVSQWSGEDYRRELFRNVPESAFIGGISASPFAANSYRNYREIATRHETERAMIRDEITRLEGKSELSESEEVALARLRKLDDAGSIADVEQAARAVAEDSFIRENANTEVSPEERAIESEAWEGATEEEIRNAAEAERNFRNFSRLPHNPQDTVDVVREIARQYPDVTFQVVRNENEFPPEIREELRRRFGKTRAASAFYYNDEVWINAGKLKPSQAEAKILHEVVGHKGLRTLFPNDRSFDAILDNIYREHFNEPGFDRVAQLNFPFHERIFETDVETGEESGSGRVNLETAEDQRIAAEEYVASIAESGAPKPNWWKEFLQSVRMWIADHFPHARQVRMTDREIETLLARSARAARRNRRGNGKVIAPESMIRFRVNENGETVFGIAGREGDFTAREILEDGTISENTPILTSEGSEVWGEITPEMADAGKELGLEALPIKLLKGKHFGNHAGFGLSHLWNQHGAELEARGYDLSDFLTGIFGKPNQIYASRQGDNIRLELVTKSKPRNIGVLELRKEDGFYSVVTAFPIDIEHYKINGKEVWRYTGSKPNKISQEGSSVISAGKQRTSPLEPLSADDAAGTARVTRPKPDINITSSGEKSSGNTGAVYSVEPEENLLAVHNLSAANVRNIVKLGGLPYPSLAIINTDVSSFDNYGEITLVADKSLIDPARKSSRVFNADVYSPRYPAVEYEFTPEDHRKIREALAPYEPKGEYRDSIDYLLDNLDDSNWQSRLRNSAAVQARYAAEQKIEYTPGEYNRAFTTQEYNDWFDRFLQELDLQPKEKIFNGYSSSGNRRYLPHTLENVVKLMKKAKVRGGEGFSYGAGSIRAHKAKQFRTLSAIQKNRNSIVSEEQMKALKEEIKQKYDELSSKIIDAAGGFVDVHDLMEAFVEGGRENQEYVNSKIPDQSLQNEIREFLDGLAELDTEYFEAKQQRVLQLNEFQGAVVPENTPPDVIESLENSGLQVVFYNPDVPDSRKAALDSLASERDLRFAVSEFSADEESDIIALLRPFVGVYMSKSDAEIVDYLRRHGVELSEEEAHAFHKLASDENRTEARKRSAKQRNDWLYENVPVWQQTVDAAGSENFKIVPSMRFRDEEMSGTFIARKKEGGMNSDELAQTIARKTGRDPLEVEQEIMDFFRDLKKPDLYRLYSDWKKQSALGDREAERRAREEWEKQEKIRIEDEALAIIEHGSSVSAEWAAENLPVYRELYRQLFRTDEAPSSIRSGDVESLNAALAQQQGDAAVFAQAYREARKKSYAEFNERLRELREKVLASKADALKLQRQALAFAENHLPQENRGEFSRAIVKLLEYSTAPTAKNPDGRRAAEFRRLFDNILERSANVRREKAVAEIDEMLDAAKIKRNYKGIPTSVLPSEQQKVDRIRKIVSLDLAAVANLIEYNNELIGRIENGQEEGRTVEAVLEDNALIETFGNLKLRSADDAENAAKQLRNLISGGKAAFAEKLAARRAELDDMRRRAVDDATFGKNSFSSRNNAKKHFEYILRHESLGTLLRIVSGKNIQDFDRSIGGELYRKVEKASGDEMTRQRLAQKALDQAMRDIAGVDSMRKKGKFLRMLTEVEEHSGVHKIEYSRPVRVGENDFVYEEGRRQLVSKSIPIEDYEFEGKPRKGARSILRDIDNGTRVAAVAGIPIDDVAVAFLRQQIADFDAGIRQSYEIFNEEADDANFNRMIEEERDGGRVVVFGHNPEEESKSVEVPLSQGAALQILLTWEQEHYQPNMKWNGWTEESIAELRKFIRPEVLKLGYWMRDEIARHRPELDRKVFERYGAHLPENSNYFPAAFRGARARAVKADSGLARGAGSLSLNPSFLIARKFHLNPVDLDANAFSSFLGNQLDQHHFLAWSDALRDLKGVYGNSTVQKAINDNFGKNVTDNLLDRIETQVRGGGKFTGEFAARMLNQMYRYWIPAKIAINPSSAIKQMFGTAAYMNHMPVADFCKNLAMANFTNPEFREFVRYARNTDYMKNRLWGGLDKDLQYLMNYTLDSRVYSPFNDALIQWGTLPTRWADQWSSLHGGFAVYKYNLEQAKKSGMSQAEAHDAAIRAWMRATDETQQSGFLKDQNYFQANQGLYRYLTAFLTNPIQVMNLQLQTIHELRYGSDKKAAARKLARQIFVNHLVVPTLMQFTNDMLRHGFNVAEWWDEVEFEDYFLAWCLGNFESLFLFGKLMSGIGNYALDRAIGRPAYQRTIISALPLGDDIQRDINTIARIVKNGEISEQDLFDAIRAIGDFGMAAGVADSRAGAVGALLSAIGTQGKRVAKWISGE